MKKVRMFFLLNNNTKWLLVEAYFYLGWARILKGLPFSKIASSLGVQMHETSNLQSRANLKVSKNVAFAIEIMSRYTFWESKCLVRAIAGMKMLERRSIESTLYLGTARDDTGEMIAHAWLRSGDVYVSGYEGMKKFTVVGKFAKMIKNNERQEVVRYN